MKKIVLATSSPSRIEAFSWLKYDFIAQASGIQEKFEGRPKTAESLVLRLAQMKAKKLAPHYPEAIVLGFDSIGFFDGKILKKPKTTEEMADRLRMLSDKFHVFITGVFLICTRQDIVLSKVSITHAKMRKLEKSEISEFIRWDQGNSMRFALGFNPLGAISASFIEVICGSHTNYLYGMPLNLVQELLKIHI